MKIYWPDVAVVITCILGYLIVGYIENKEVEAANSRAEAYREVMVACLNRGGFYFKDTKKTYLCDAKEI